MTIQLFVHLVHLTVLKKCPSLLNCFVDFLIQGIVQRFSKIYCLNCKYRFPLDVSVHHFNEKLIIDVG